MPELPEVQTIVNDLKKKIIGRKITAVWFDVPKIIKKPEAGKLEKQIKGLKITEVKRRGKNILIYLSNNPRMKSNNNRINKTIFDKNLRNRIRDGFEKILLIHQKLTGHLLVGKWKIEKGRAKSLIKGPFKEKVNDYIHLIFYLSPFGRSPVGRDDGWQMALSDLRKFAKVLFGEKEEIENLPDLAKIGPEPLDKNFTFPIFKILINKQKGKIKQVLMNQEIIAGIGNIYSDEMLWLAKIHPFKPANKLTVREIKVLYLALKQILKKAIKLRGSSVSDYRDTAGRSGSYAEKRFVYQKEGEQCSRCKTPIKRVKMGGRSAHFCPTCQRLKP